MINKVIQGDCLEVMKRLDENSVDSIVTDPPYELGFMGKSWDNTGIANNKEMWKECLRVLKPGGHLLSFGGTRTYHRMASAIEDAGFEVRDMIEWVYGSGFPKSLNIGKAVDKLQGNEREVVGTYEIGGMTPDRENFGANDRTGGKGMGFRPGEITNTKGTSEWEGWGTALKPAHEPICMARKPLAEKTVAENCLKWGTGGINIDESRVESNEVIETGRAGRSGASNFNASIGEEQPTHSKRFPANLIHDNSEEVRECFPDTKTGKAIRSNSGGKTFGGENTKPVMEDLGYEDGGGNASRFFKSIIYQAKASKSERNKGCEELEESILARSGGAQIAENNGEEYEECQGIGLNRVSKMKNNHPTVKPIALMEYLIKMVTPKGGTVLEPFAGSGTTLVAAKQNGYQYIGIEKEKEYIDIINKRLENGGKW